ncbi:hypothetical protein F2Q68_00044679 [Brassica cretica]|uniref:HAUS augmin-like complex subunit 6 N-terminal domain-containing protein n=1 Tax=Brassica cretica TaxID=69181 RepID=A0A8S9LKJ1_BRACR|nr:hypothetical protein F2Q68_00044679 [Brassica cretica]
MTMDREKERELELESAMYTNCSLLGLDPNVIGLGSSNGTPRVGLFRHSNPKLGEQLLYFILSSLRGPAQSSKARIAVERRRFLKDAETAVQRQAMWSNLAHEMTAEFRGLCAEEAYLQQELEKLNDLRNKVKQEGEVWDDLVSSSSLNSHLVSKSTRLWDSIMARKGQHEVLASGPIEDLIAHREHRYRISGSALLAAMDQSSQVPRAELLSAHSDDSASLADDKELSDGSYANMHDHSLVDGFETNSQASDETLSRVDDRGGRNNQTVDVAEIIRRWTHALQRIHKQSLQLVLEYNMEFLEAFGCILSSKEVF